MLDLFTTSSSSHEFLELAADSIDGVRGQHRREVLLCLQVAVSGEAALPRFERGDEPFAPCAKRFRMRRLLREVMGLVGIGGEMEELLRV